MRCLYCFEISWPQLLTIGQVQAFIGRLVVNVLALYSNKPSLNPLKSSVLVLMLFEESKLSHKKRPGLAHFENIFMPTAKAREPDCMCFYLNRFVPIWLELYLHIWLEMYLHTWLDMYLLTSLRWHCTYQCGQIFKNLPSLSPTRVAPFEVVKLMKIVVLWHQLVIY